MSELDNLRPEVREAVREFDGKAYPGSRTHERWQTIRAELLRLANENFGKHLALSEHDALCEQSTTYRLRAEKAEGDCNDLRKRLNDAISERNTIRRERAQEHRKHARERAELAAFKARMFRGIVLDVDDLARGHAGLPSEWRGKRVLLVVEE